MDEKKEDKKKEEKNEGKKLEEKSKPSKENKDPKETSKEKTKESPQKKSEVKQAPKKDFAIARGLSLRISPKYSIFVCRMIKGKTPDQAVSLLRDVIEGKRPVHMRPLEVPHQKGKGVSGAKFPKNVCREIIPIINQARANALVVGIEEPIITIAKSDRAPAPFRRGGRKAKRTHIFIEVRDKKTALI